MSGIALAPFVSASAPPSVAYVTSIFATTSGSTATLSSLNVAAGDFALFGSVSTGTVSSPGGAWTSIGTDGAFQYRYRALNSTDIAGSISYGSGCVIMIWSGGIATAARRSSGNFTGATPVAATGFVKNAKHAGIAAFSYVTGGALGTPTITTPATFTNRGSATYASQKSTGYDRLSPAYVDSTAFSATFTGSTSGVYTIIELMLA